MNRPVLECPCDFTGCGHGFGEHYATYDKKYTGCTGTQLVGGLVVACPCHGFMAIYREEAVVPVQTYRTDQYR